MSKETIQFHMQRTGHAVKWANTVVAENGNSYRSKYFCEVCGEEVIMEKSERISQLEEAVKALYCQFAYRSATGEMLNGGLAALQMAEAVIGQKALEEYDKA